MAGERLQTTCCIVGGGPAGIMLGYLLARNRVEVTVLEKHQDFFRDFRGDSVHPSTLEVIHELGLLDDFLRLSEITLGQWRLWRFCFPGGRFPSLADALQIRRPDAPVGLPGFSLRARKKISQLSAPDAA